MRRQGPFHLHTELLQMPCLHAAHNLATQDGRVLRYSDTMACLACTEGLRRPQLQLDVNRIEPRYQPKFLEFWASVDIKDPSECWPWAGYRHKSGRAEFPFRRGQCNDKQRSHWSPARVAFWFSWGDVVRLSIRHTCGNPHCCNPLHLRAVRVPHQPWAHRLDWLDLQLSSKKLRAEAARLRHVALEVEDTPHAPLAIEAPRISHQRFLAALQPEAPRSGALDCEDVYRFRS